MLSDVPYLAVLVVSIAGLALVDFRLRLLFWQHPGAASLTLVSGVAFFLLWDLVGIALGVFFRGNATNLSGIMLAPELPLEEPFFLTLLCYFTMLCYSFSKRLIRNRTLK
jgi:lycopene cyclase domain-containing protein